MGMHINVISKPSPLTIKENIEITEDEHESDSDNVTTRSLHHDNSNYLTYDPQFDRKRFSHDQR